MSNLLICDACIGNSTYSSWICENGFIGTCEIDPNHKLPRKVVRASEIAAIIDQWFRANYVVGELEASFDANDRMSYDQHGDPYADIFAEELSCAEKVVDAIDAHLPDASNRDISKGDESFYDEANLYESMDSAQKREDEKSEAYWFEYRIYFQWQDFCEAAIYKRRFFGLKDQLDELFGDPQEYEKGQINPIYDLPSGQKIYRARLIDDDTLQERVRKNPSIELDAPPKTRARAGRMNVEFIPAFYGAFSEETAVAEIRPGINENVAIGEFELRRALKVFDFTVFSRLPGDGWRQAALHTRYEFINEMEGEISRPILPYDKQREYIPTQIVAEYLGECFGCEAVIYRSSMIKGHDKESRNIVLLNSGFDFQQGQNAPLRFVSHSIRRVYDIEYKLDDDDIPF